MQFKLIEDYQKKEFKDRVNEIFLKYNNQDKIFYLDVVEGEKIRSLQQNKYYWGVVVPICTEIIKQTDGRILDSDQVHEQLKYQFGTLIFSEHTNYSCLYGEKIISWNDFDLLPNDAKCKCQRLFNMPSTTKMSTIKFNEYIKLISEWAGFLGFEIPEPNYN